MFCKKLFSQDEKWHAFDGKKFRFLRMLMLMMTTMTTLAANEVVVDANADAVVFLFD